MKEIVAVIFGFGLLFNALLFVPQVLAIARKKTDEAAKLLGRNVQVTGAEGGPIKVQQGVELSAVLKVLQAAGAMRELEEPQAGELIGEEDEPVG